MASGYEAHGGPLAAQRGRLIAGRVNALRNALNHIGCDKALPGFCLRRFHASEVEIARSVITLGPRSGLVAPPIRLKECRMDGATEPELNRRLVYWIERRYAISCQRWPSGRLDHDGMPWPRSPWRRNHSRSPSVAELDVLAAQGRLFVAISHGVGAMALGTMFAIDKSAGGDGFGMGGERIDPACDHWREHDPSES